MWLTEFVQHSRTSLRREHASQGTNILRSSHVSGRSENRLVVVVSGEVGFTTVTSMPLSSSISGFSMATRTYEDRVAERSMGIEVRGQVQAGSHRRLRPQALIAEG